MLLIFYVHLSVNHSCGSAFHASIYQKDNKNSWYFMSPLLQPDLYHTSQQNQSWLLKSDLARKKKKATAFIQNIQILLYILL